MTANRWFSRWILVAAWAVPVIGGLGTLVPVTAEAQSYTWMTHAALQVVNPDDGSNAWPGTSQAPPIQMIGVVINNPWDMLDFSVDAAKPQWQTYIQAAQAGTYGGYTVQAGDFGGTALYMGMYRPWGKPPASIIYDSAAWTAEMERLNGAAGAGEAVLQQGDVILVQASAPGLFYNGKYNINEQHSGDTSKDFSITVLQRGVSLDSYAAAITLADLKDASDQYLFDATRVTGTEHYQGSLVHLDGLLLADPANWGLDHTVTVRQGDLTFALKLGIDPDLSLVNASLLASTPFSLTAILDQEDGSTPDSPGYDDGYRLWLTNASDLTLGTANVPEPATWTLLVGIGSMLGLGIARRRRAMR